MRQRAVMTATIVRESRRQASLRLLGCSAFVTLGLWGARTIPDPRSDALLYWSAAFFAVLALRYLWSIYRPGTLTLDEAGMTENLGWKRLHWAWAEIDHTEVIQTPGGLASACLIYPHTGGRVRLFGWRLSANELHRRIEEYRAR
jgi:hypothetical protein